MAQPGQGPTLSAADLLKSKRQNGTFDVFLCHNSLDKSRVKDIGRKLKELGILPWLDEWELRPGMPWQDALEQQINHVRSAAVFVGSEGIGPWQHQELAALLRKFVDLKSPVIPVLLPEAAAEPDLPLFLVGMTWVDFRESDPDPMRRLVWGITGQNDSDDDDDAPTAPMRPDNAGRPQPPPAENANPAPWQQAPAGLAQTLIGSWQIQITNPYGVVSQMMLQIMPGNIFRGQVPVLLAMGTVEGMWQLSPMNELTLQGRHTLGFQVLPYLTVIQLQQVGPYQLAGFTSAGEQTAWQKIG